MTARRNALVTGASSGIGAAIAAALAAEGWGVALGARRVERLEDQATAITRSGGTVCTHPLDVTDPASIDACFAAAERALGPIDTVVNNAGIARPGRLDDTDPADLGHEIATDLLGALLCTRALLRRLLPEGRRGDVVFISSDVTEHPRPWMVGYAAAKAGLEGAARALALELEGTGVRTTTVRVGPTLTDFAETWAPERIDELLAAWPRFGIQRHFETLDPADVARAVVHALSAPPTAWTPVLEIQPVPPPS